MTTRVTKEMAEDVMTALKNAHEEKPWYKKVVLGTGDLGYCVDLWVDRQKFRSRKDQFKVPGAINNVIVCVMLHG